MNSFVDRNTLWLLLTNLLLGLAVVVCSTMIAWRLARDKQQGRREKKDESLVPGDYLNGLGNLGVPLHDEGERIDKMAEE